MVSVCGHGFLVHPLARLVLWLYRAPKPRRLTCEQRATDAAP